MNRPLLSVCAITALGLAALPGASVAQQKSMKDQLVGTWTLLLSDGVKADGTHVPEFGPNPSGTLMFSPNGHYSLEIMRANLPKFASNNRDKVTTDESKAVVQGTLAHFGTYQVLHSPHRGELVPELERHPAEAADHRAHRRCVDLQRAESRGRSGTRHHPRRTGVATGKVA